MFWCLCASSLKRVHNILSELMKWSRNRAVRLSMRWLTDKKPKLLIHSSTTLLLLVCKIFMNTRVTVKSNECLCRDIGLTGHASVPYNIEDIHFVFSKFKTTSSEAKRPIACLHLPIDLCCCAGFDTFLGRTAILAPLFDYVRISKETPRTVEICLSSSGGGGVENKSLGDRIAASGPIHLHQSIYEEEAIGWLFHFSATALQPLMLCD